MKTDQKTRISFSSKRDSITTTERLVNVQKQENH